jgi:hypothetical protein
MTPLDDLSPNADLSLALAGPTTIHRGESISLRLFVQAGDNPIRGVTFLAVLPSAYRFVQIIPPPAWTCHALNVGSSVPALPVRLYGEKAGWLLAHSVEEIWLDLIAAEFHLESGALAAVAHE